MTEPTQKDRERATMPAVDLWDELPVGDASYNIIHRALSRLIASTRAETERAIADWLDEIQLGPFVHTDIYGNLADAIRSGSYKEKSDAPPDAKEQG